VSEAVREDILSLRLQPGTLLDETELAGRFKVSRSPIREALIRLSGEGLEQTLRNRSSNVAPCDVSIVQSHLSAWCSCSV
jgi:DNA-binding GntR family transcriptional regulator